MIKPVLKWAGGKTALAGELSKIILTEKFERYVELFFGGGGLFFSLNNYDNFSQSKNHIINDVNKDLINLYKDIKRDPKNLIKEHKKIQKQFTDKDYYYIRDMLNGNNKSRYEGITRSAALMLLNKTCYNGLYRVNSKGDFNVPVGKYKKISYVRDEEINLLAGILPYLKNIMNKDYKDIDIRKNDFVYLDPPYDILKKESFTDYAIGNFGKKEQKELKNHFQKIDKIGAKVMMSNSDTKFIRELYNDYTIKEVLAPRGISPTSSRKVKELIILGNNFQN